MNKKYNKKYNIMNINITILLVILILILASISMYVSVLYFRRPLNTSLEIEPLSKIDNLMIEADLPENFNYFIELLVNKLVETTKEISKNRSSESSESSEYQNCLMSAIKDKFVALNKVSSSTNVKTRHGKKLVEELNKKIDTNKLTEIVKDKDIEQAIDLNENLITVVYPFLLD